MSDEVHDTRSVTAEALIRMLQGSSAATCGRCGASLCPHQVLMCVFMGFKDSPVCFDCLAKVLENSREVLAENLLSHMTRRDCYRAAWLWADEHENPRVGSCPKLPLPGEPRPPRMDAHWDPEPGRDAVHRVPVITPEKIDEDVGWDAGEMGCGDLVLELRQRLHSMEAGQVLKLSARDPGAREDLPAWCRLTGHHLLRAQPPEYWIKRKE